MDTDKSKLPKVVISSCLLGEAVRYDGGHKLQSAILAFFQNKVQWMPVCPEMEFGLGCPRDSMHLQGDVDNPSLVVSKTGQDLSERFKSWLFTRLDELRSENLSGMLLKSKSPSCGISSVPVFADEDQSLVLARDSSGLFASAFLSSFQDIPTADEASLNGPDAMEEFYRQILYYHAHFV